MHRHRITKALLFPILAPIFLVGCVLSLIGESQARTAPKRVVSTPLLDMQVSKKDDVQMGLMQELTEDPITNA